MRVPNQVRGVRRAGVTRLNARPNGVHPARQSGVSVGSGLRAPGRGPVGYWCCDCPCSCGGITCDDDWTAIECLEISDEEHTATTCFKWRSASPASVSPGPTVTITETPRGWVRTTPTLRSHERA